MNARKPNGFFIHADRFATISTMLSFAEIGRLITAVCAYFETGETPASRSRKFLACFELLREDIDRDVARYRDICERNREFANRRWQGADSSSASSPSPKDAKACSGMPAHADACLHNATQPNTTQPNTTQSNTTQSNTAQPNAAQPNAAQPNAAQPNAAKARVPAGTKAPQRNSPFGTQTKGDLSAHDDPRFTGCTLL